MAFSFPLLRKFLAGAGLLMFGLYLFEESIKSLGGRQLKRLLEKQTKTARKALRAGTWISGITTSSTFVSLLLVAFVGGGLLSLYHAIPVILGANIGTTLNSLWVAYVGFGDFKISKLALPLISFGGIIHMVTKKKHWLDIAHIAIGLGLLFVGLDYMKSSVEILAESISLDGYSNLFTYGVLGFAVTALLHSQAAMSLITLSALNAGIISIAPAFAIIIGANVGTTMTALVASLSGSKSHKQVALAHMLQNVFAAIIGAVFFNQFMWLCNVWLAELLGYEGNYILATAWFNTVFNILTAIPFLFVGKHFTMMLEYITNTPKNQEYHFFIDKFRGIGPIQETLGIQLDALQKDTAYIQILLRDYTLSLFKSQYHEDQIEEKLYDTNQQEELYHHFKDAIDHVYSFYILLQESSFTRHDVSKSKKISTILEKYTEIAKRSKSIATNLDEFSHDTHPSVTELYTLIKTHFTQIVTHTGSLATDTLEHAFLSAIKEAAKNKTNTDIATLITTEKATLDITQKRNDIAEGI